MSLQQQETIQNPFTTRARFVHGDRYDYSRVAYTNGNSKVVITCPKHGDFVQTARMHLAGKGCRECDAIKTSESIAATKISSFIARAKQVHGKKYDYSKTKYYKGTAGVIITCPEHGDFKQSMAAHLAGNGCKECGLIDKSRNVVEAKTKKFILKAREIHGKKYDYSKAIYYKGNTRITIKCPIHGEFKQTAVIHLAGKGCRVCGIIKQANATKALNKLPKKEHTLEDFLDQARAAHGDKYIYDKTVYRVPTAKVTITCPEHGDFEQVAKYHMNGRGCSKCAIQSKVYTTEVFIEKAKKEHGDKYTYDKVVYVSSNKKVIITCPKHGDFLKTPAALLSGGNCPTCADANRSYTRKGKPRFSRS